MRSLRDLLATWENWSARETTRRAMANASSGQQQEVIAAALCRGEDVNPLDALRDANELASLLIGWRWQAMRAARDTGTSWDEIGAAVRITAVAAESEYAKAMERNRSITSVKA